MSHPRTVLVATDLSERGNEAIRQAGAWASAWSARLVACFVLPPPGIRPLFPQSAVEDAGRSEANLAAAGAVARRVASLTGRTEDELSIRIERGSAYAEILRCAERERADLIVVGARGEGSVRRLLLGSTAERVVRYAPSSVLVARPRRPPVRIDDQSQISPGSSAVLAATDLSDPSLPALKAGAEYARRHHVRLNVLHCFHDEAVAPIAAAAFAAPLATAEDRARLREVAAQALGKALRKLDIDANPIIEEGPAARAIIAQAAQLGTDLIVVGTVGRTGLERLVLGSVAEAVVRNAACSTLVVRLNRKEARS